MYKLKKNPNNGEVHMVIRTEGNVQTYIPFVEDNSDYQAYLKWIEEGNTVLPAEENQ